MNIITKGFTAALIAGSVFMFSCSSDSTTVENDTDAKIETGTDEGAAHDHLSGTFGFDNTNSMVAWTGTKVTGSHNGTINLSDGQVDIKDGVITSGEFIIDMSSITVLDIEDAENNGKLKGHLSSDDFFGIENHPTATFSVTEGKMGKMGGDLTIKGITKPANMTYMIVSNDAGHSINGTTTIDRTAYDIQYGSGKFFDDLGDKMINDMFTLDFELKMAE